MKRHFPKALSKVNLSMDRMHSLLVSLDAQPWPPSASSHSHTNSQATNSMSIDDKTSTGTGHDASTHSQAFTVRDPSRASQNTGPVYRIADPDLDPDAKPGSVVTDYGGIKVYEAKTICKLFLWRTFKRG